MSIGWGGMPFMNNCINIEAMKIPLHHGLHQEECSFTNRRVDHQGHDDEFNGFWK